MPAQASLFTQAMDAAANMTSIVHCKQEPYDVYIGRPGNWGNPFVMASEADRNDVIDQFRSWGESQPWFRHAAAMELKGKTLGCWCKPKACHGQVLSEWAEDKPNWVFVFGSNAAGRHGKGAASHAVKWHGAHHGIGKGMQPGGRSWALPTKDENLNTLPLFRIQEHIADLFDEARANPGLHYQLTRIGTGLAGYSDEEVLETIKGVGPTPDNVHLPGAWLAINKDLPPRVIVAGSRTMTDQSFIETKLDRLNRRFDGKFEIVSGGAKGVDWFGEEYAVRNNIPFVRFPPLWESHGKPAGIHRNQLMAWYATHLVAFHQGNSPGTRSMINLAEKEGLASWVIEA